MDICQEGANYSYCECTLDYIMDEYPDTEDLEYADDGGFQVIMDAAEYCVDLIY